MHFVPFLFAFSSLHPGNDCFVLCLSLAFRKVSALWIQCGAFIAQNYYLNYLTIIKGCSRGSYSERRSMTMVMMIMMRKLMAMISGMMITTPKTMCADGDDDDNDVDTE